MKSTNIFLRVLAGAVGLILFCGCGPRIALGNTAATEADEPPASVPAPVSAPTDGGEPASTNRPVVVMAPRTPPPHLKLPDGVEAVIKLAESGVEDSVLLAYIANSSASFDLSADDILYLNDVGISSPVVSAMLNHSNKASSPGPNPNTVASQPVITPPPATLEPPPPNPYPQVSATPSPVPVEAPLTPPVQETYNYFYSALQPYGDWVDVPDYGLCWQPTVAIVQVDWRPYCDRGHWLYSDCGWYWHSDYSWGWAPFHYGRWHHAPYHGWVWIPDTTWGASWVCWRRGEGYCGWAPLPPAAVYQPGIGFTFHDSHVGVSFGFGLGYDRFTFVPTRHFYDRNPRVYVTPVSQTVNIYKNTTVVNNYIQGNNHTVINEGIGRDHIAAGTHQEIRKVAIRDVPVSSAVNVRPERLERSGSTPVIYRPTPPPVKTQAAEIVHIQQQQPHVLAGITPSRPAQVSRLEARPSLPQTGASPAGNPNSSIRRNEIARTTPGPSTAPVYRNQEPARQSVPETRSRTPERAQPVPAYQRPAPAPNPEPTVRREEVARTSPEIPGYRNQEPNRQSVPEVKPSAPEYPRQEIRRPEYQLPPNTAPAPAPSYNARPFLSPGPAMAPSTIPRPGGSSPVYGGPSVPSVQHSSPAPAPPPVQHSQPQPQPSARSNNRDEQRR